MSQDLTTRQLVVFSLGSEEYALPIGQVHEIIRYAEPRSVASADPSVLGVISLRGRILPVFDLATRLGLPRGEAEGKIVIVETDDAMAGVVVDDVEEVLTVDGEQLDEAPGADRAVIDGIAKIDDRLVVLLNSDGVVRGHDEAGLAGDAAAEAEGAALKAAA